MGQWSATSMNHRATGLHRTAALLRQWMGSTGTVPLRGGAVGAFGVWRVRANRDGMQGNNHERI